MAKKDIQDINAQSSVETNNTKPKYTEEEKKAYKASLKNKSTVAQSTQQVSGTEKQKPVVAETVKPKYTEEEKKAYKASLKNKIPVQKDTKSTQGKGGTKPTSGRPQFTEAERESYRKRNEIYQRRIEVAVGKVAAKRDAAIDMINTLDLSGIKPDKTSFVESQIEIITTLAKIDFSTEHGRDLIKRIAGAINVIHTAVSHEDNTFILRYEIAKIGELAEKTKELNNIMSKIFAGLSKTGSAGVSFASDKKQKDYAFLVELENDISKNSIASISEIIEKCHLAGHGLEKEVKAARERQAKKSQPIIKKMVENGQTLEEVMETTKLSLNVATGLFKKAREENLKIKTPLILKMAKAGDSLETIVEQLKLSTDVVTPQYKIGRKEYVISKSDEIKSLAEQGSTAKDISEALNLLEIEVEKLYKDGRAKYIQTFIPKIEEAVVKNVSQEALSKELNISVQELRRLYIIAQRTYYATHKVTVLASLTEGKKIEDIAKKLKLDSEILSSSVDFWLSQQQKESEASVQNTTTEKTEEATK